MKKKFLTLVTIVLAMVMSLFTFVGCAGDDLKGFDIDLAKAVAEELDIDVEFKLIVWDNKDTEIAAGTIDLIWNGMTITEERKGNLEISKPYLTNSQVMVVKNDSTLTKKTITNSTKFCAENGSAGHDLIVGKEATDDAPAVVGFYPNNPFTPAADQITCLTEVLAGTSDVAVVDSILAGYYINNNESTFKGELKIITKPNSSEAESLSSEEYGIAAKKGSVGFMAKINDTLAKLYAEGKMQKIATDYGVNKNLVASAWLNAPTNSYDSASEKASWEKIENKGKIVIGYTLFAPIAFK